jgi:two-component system, OmpR family, osmolarity sensor histidine kinase EnvZ
MKRFVGSLYARLALVFLLALGASYATMYWMFVSQMEEARTASLARSIATQARLVEEILQARLPADVPAVKGLRLALEPPRTEEAATAGNTRQISLLKQRLAEELGRPVAVIASAVPEDGVWIELQGPGDEHRWMSFGGRKPRTHRADPLLLSLLVGFAVFFAGGMLLLWQIQRPLKRLGVALEGVGQLPRLTRLPVEGAGETRVLSERYNDMVERLQRFEEDRATMLAGVAHDLRTPITRMRLLVELEQASRRQAMLQNLDDIARITEQFLIYARGSTDEPVEQRDLGLLAEEVAASYAGRGVSVVCEANDVRSPVRVNSLRRALSNLIENAIEYGATPVVVRTSYGSQSASIGVEDAGPGIEPSQIARALRPFTRLDNSRGGKGHCGLGLLIASKIAQEHRGALKLRNREGGGFVAEILLPVTAQPL